MWNVNNFLRYFFYCLFYFWLTRFRKNFCNLNCATILIKLDLFFVITYKTLKFFCDIFFYCSLRFWKVFYNLNCETISIKTNSFFMIVCKTLSDSFNIVSFFVKKLKINFLSFFYIWCKILMILRFFYVSKIFDEKNWIEILRDYY